MTTRESFEESKAMLTDDEANKQGVQLLRLMKLIYKPIPIAYQYTNEQTTYFIKNSRQKRTKVRTFVTRKTKRIYSFLKAGNFKECMFRLTVRYENSSTNEGLYQAKNDLIYALKAFTEPD